MPGLRQVFFTPEYERGSNLRDDGGVGPRREPGILRPPGRAPQGAFEAVDQGAAGAGGGVAGPLCRGWGVGQGGLIRRRDGRSCWSRSLS